jgi:hypothetical protein
MSFIVAGIAAGIAAVAGALLGARALRKRRPQVMDAPVSACAAKALPALDMQVGDVVLFGQEEAWLKAAFLLEEATTCVAAVFFTHLGPDRDVVFVRPAPQALLLRMRRAAVDVSPGTPPAVLEHDGRRYQRASRRPVCVRAIGEELPRMDDTAMWSWFESSEGMVMAVLSGATATLVWVADPAADSSAVRLAAGQATFRPL